MVTVLNFKDVVDLPRWRPLHNAPANYFARPDFRNNEDRHPIIYQGTNITIPWHTYNPLTDQWLQLGNLATTSAATFMACQGPRGTIAAGATTTSIPLTTALPAAVGVNQLANRGDDRGFKIRIIGNAAGSSGKTEERIIVGNTSGTTPILTLDSPLSFIPIVGDAYEMLSGRIFHATNGPTFRYYDVATNFAVALSAVNLPATVLDNAFIALDELYVPYDRTPGEGFFGFLTATATGAASLTGQAAGGDATVLANEYRNFQIRIIEDIAIPTAVGQRRNITSHTVGASPVYTVPAWAVIPSATAKYVIENNGDRLLLWVNGNINTFTYQVSTNTWDSSVTFAARPAAPSTGVSAAHCFSIEPDTAKNARHSHILSYRSGIIWDLFDIAGAATGLWTGNITYGYSGAIGIGFGSGVQEPITNEGRYFYFWIASTGHHYRFDIKNRILEAVGFLRYPITVGVSGGLHGMTTHHFQDGSTKLAFIMTQINNDVRFFQLPITIG